jgi:hypothetical protein
MVALSLLDYEDHIRRNSEKPITKSKRRIIRADTDGGSPQDSVPQGNEG